MASVFATVTPTPVSPAPWRAVLARHWPLLAILAVTLAIRAPTFGNPVLEHDEQLYLVVGDRMLHGQLPYVDMWDRKPPGLFAMFALIRLLGGDGVIQYQLVAAGCVFATAVLIFAMARRTCSRRGAVIAAIAYICFLNPLNGAGGQSSVMYNPLTALAAWAALGAGDAKSHNALVARALLAMVAAGLAIQCKYTPVVEGAYFGLLFLWRFHRAGMAPARIAATAGAMVALASLPTAAAVWLYWWSGHLDAFVQANILSVFHRRPFPAETRFAQKVFVSIIGGPALILSAIRLVGRLLGHRAQPAIEFWPAFGWLVAAMIGFGMLGDFYDFYFITVLPPLLVFTAPLADRTGRGGFATGMLLAAWPYFLGPPQLGVTAKRRAETAALADAIRPLVADGHCLYVYDGPTILYMMTHACVPTRFIYPDHLNNPTELPALGVDARTEEARLLATKPGAIVTANLAVIPRVDPGTRSVLVATLRRDYVRVRHVDMPGYRNFDVWALKALHPGPGMWPGAPIDPR